MLGCSCGDLFCALGCVAGKTLDSVSSQVKTCGSGCASSADEQWEAYKTEFKKTYASADEEAERRGIFDESNKRIADLNEKNGKVAFTWTRQSDRKEEEKHYRGAVRPTETNRKSAPVKAATIASVPSAINWAETIAVTPIKNQGQCGSCWAFSATETIESEYVLTAAISVDDVVSLSPQQITSCTTDCDGCGGGWPSSGYEYVEGVVGLSNDWYWPYSQSMLSQSATAACNTSLSVFSGADAELAGGYATVTGFSYVVPECSSGSCANQDMAGLAAAAAEGPVSICVNAGAWNDYAGSGTVMTQAACGGYGAADLDHCVQLVGYNTTAADPYWIVRNSWSTTWGNDGYIYLEYPANTCGLANEATKPVIGNAEATSANKQRLFEQATKGAFATMI
jgi:C1A family cysteine protease